MKTHRILRDVYWGQASKPLIACCARNLFLWSIVIITTIIPSLSSWLQIVHWTEVKKPLLLEGSAERYLISFKCSNEELKAFYLMPLYASSWKFLNWRDGIRRSSAFFSYQEQTPLLWYLNEVIIISSP